MGKRMRLGVLASGGGSNLQAIIDRCRDDSFPPEIATVIQTMSPSEAVMRLELSNQSALMFRNAQHGGLNMVYRRGDGNVGWVDPDGNKKD